MAPKKAPPSWKRRWREDIRPLLILGLVICAARSSLADWYSVPTGSMKPTILEGDRVFVNKLAYDLKVPFTTWPLATWAHPQRGDVVICRSPEDGTRLVKRIVGLPGDTVELRNHQLFLNGEPVDYGALDESIPAQLNEVERRASIFATEHLPSHPHAVMATPALPTPQDHPPQRIPKGRYFVMGDNRTNSRDSRMWGTVPRKNILGRTSAVVISFNPDRYRLPRRGRWFRALDPVPAET
jgi:signal peptidase I